MGDYFPRNDSELLAWLSSLSKGLTTYGATLGFSDAEVKADQKICSDLVSLIQTDEQKRRDWLAAAEATKTFKQKELPTLRTTIARLKTAPGYSQGIGQILGVIGSASQAIVKEEVKPALRASSQGGKIELRFTRGRLSGINVYMRKKGREYVAIPRPSCTLSFCGCDPCELRDRLRSPRIPCLRSPKGRRSRSP